MLTIMLVIVHVPVAIGAIQKRRGTLRHPRRWTLAFDISEYVFLTLTCTALIGTAADVDRWWKQQELQHQLQTNEDYAESLDATTALAHIRHEPWWDACVHTRVQAADAWTAGRRLAEDNQLLPARRKLQEAIDLYAHFIDTFGGNHLEEGTNPEDRAVWMARVESDRSAAEGIVTLINETAKGSLERTFFLLSPYIVAAGLAIRFAKVSAKLAGLY